MAQKQGLSFSLQLTQPTFVAYHEVDRRIVALDKTGEIKRLAEDEEAAIEGVAHFEFGVLGSLHDELFFAQIAEGATAIGHPRHLDKVAFFELTGFDVRRQHRIRVAFLADALDKLVPVGEAEKSRQDLQRAVTGLVGTVDVTPEAFQGGGAHGLARAFKHGTTKEDEVGRRLHLTFQVRFDAVLEFSDFRACLFHAAKMRLFSD